MRLIDADALLSSLAKLESGYEYAEGNDKYEFVYGTLTGVRQAITYTKSAPTVDIKTEVAREIFAEIEENSEIYNEYGDYYIDNGIYNFIKNKYTKE